MIEYVLHCSPLRISGGYHPDGVNLIVLGDSPAEIQARSRCHVRINLRCPVSPAGRQVRNEGAEWQAPCERWIHVDVVLLVMLVVSHE